MTADELVNKIEEAIKDAAKLGPNAFDFIEGRGLYFLRREIKRSIEAIESSLDQYQDRVRAWILAAFGEQIADDRQERVYRFLEEALEVAQASGLCSRKDVTRLADYVFSRPKGDLPQEIGGAMSTLASLAYAHRIKLAHASTTELERCWQTIDRIREKQRNKPHGSPLPES